MFVSRLRYFTLLLLCLTVYFASGEWLSRVVLLTVALLPWLSLLLSLPAIARFRLSATGVDAFEMGEQSEAWLLGSCDLPMPPFRGRIRVTRLFTGERTRYDPDKGLPGSHCGGLTLQAEKGRVCDYLGIFAFPARSSEGKTVLIRPKQTELPELPDLQRYIAGRWRPKPGGGFSENHELRLYRPGDNLNQVHWKLSAKTGQLILREPMEPQRGLVLVTLTLRGTPQVLDSKLGQLRQVGAYLLSHQVSFEVRALTGEGILSFPIAEERELGRCLDSLLCQRVAATGSVRDWDYHASWLYHIGGDADEV